MEHSATLNTVEALSEEFGIPLYMLRLSENGQVSLEHLEELLKDNAKALVTLVHGNNEIGNLTDIKAVGELCHTYGAFFHTDAVQTLGFREIDVKESHIDALSGTGHKFHGPKGIGFLYLTKGHKVKAIMHGGSQERGLRSGTESVYSIVGMAKALELAYERLEQDSEHILSLKKHMMNRLDHELSGIKYNGASADVEQSLHKVLSVSIPTSMDTAMLLFSLDLEGISATGGSACGSGAQKGSHVLEALGKADGRVSIRFSFSRYNTVEEVDQAVDVLKKILSR